MELPPRTMPIKPGIIFCLVGPAGVGKTTLRETMQRDPVRAMSLSATTRAPRDGEVDGRDYRFLTPEQFTASEARGEFATTADVFGQRYAMIRAPFDEALRHGHDIFCDIVADTVPALAAAYPNHRVVTVCILPHTDHEKSLEIIEHRLKKRGDAPDRIASRLAKTGPELDQLAREQFDHTIIGWDKHADRPLSTFEVEQIMESIIAREHGVQPQNIIHGANRLPLRQFEHSLEI